MAPPAHRVTTAHLGAAYPFMARPGPRCGAVVIGRHLFGGAFLYDPFELYGRGELTNPNMVVVGQIGRGKSAFVKSYVWRQALLGRQAWVIDPKGEYGPLASAWGVEPIRLRPGGPVRLNPLEAGGLGPGGEGDDGDRRQAISLVASLAESSLGRRLLPRERTAVELALSAARAGGPRANGLPEVVRALLDPAPDSAERIHTDRRALAEDGRDVALELRRLVEGDLQGMFDGPTTPGLDLDGAFVVLDLSAVYSSPALGVLMTCAASFLATSLRRPGRRQRILVADEAWAVLSNLSVARWLQASWKLSRAFGVANVAVLHRLSDLGAAGAAGSEQVRLAEGLLSDSETSVVFAQPPGEADACRELLGLSEVETLLLPRLGRGVALWKVGRASFLVEHHLSRLERRLVDTDGAMTFPDGAVTPPDPDGRPRSVALWADDR
jgi:hypothetical protein